MKSWEPHAGAARSAAPSSAKEEEGGEQKERVPCCPPLSEEKTRRFFLLARWLEKKKVESRARVESERAERPLALQRSRAQRVSQAQPLKPEPLPL